MARFTQRVRSHDRIDVDPSQIEEVLADTDLLAALTPAVASIDVSGRRWHWQMVGFSALGINAAPRLTTVMDLSPGRIEFEPDPEAGDIADAEGRLQVREDDQGRAQVDLDLTAGVELPLPTFSARAVRRVMVGAIRTGGARFSANLLDHLGNPPNRGMRTWPVDDDATADVAAAR